MRTLLKYQATSITDYVKKKSLIGLHGLGCVTYPEFVRKGSLLGEKIGLFEIENTLSNIEIRNKESITLANKLLKSK